MSQIYCKLNSKIEYYSYNQIKETIENLTKIISSETKLDFLTIIRSSD